MAFGALFSLSAMALRHPVSPDAVVDVRHPGEREGKRLACLMAWKQLDHKLPLDGQFALYGHFGHGTLVPGPIGEEFVDYAATAEEGIVIDVGAGFGRTTRMVALGEWSGAHHRWRRPPRPIIAVDLFEMNLRTLLAMAPKRARDRITAWRGEFPYLPLEEESVVALNLGSVLHFMSGTEIDEAMTRVKGWMKPGGKVFIEAQTPFLKSFDKFLPQYHHNIMMKRRWPGWIAKVKQFVPERGDLGSVNLMDIETLKRMARDHGFVVERVGYFWRQQYPKDLNGDVPHSSIRNLLISSPAPSVGMILRKPWPGEV